MMAKKGSRAGTRGEDPREEPTRLQAILLADSFTTDEFRPITLDRPKVCIYFCKGNSCISFCNYFLIILRCFVSRKVLLPLVNTPMIEYTLAWLESVGVDEVFVFCCDPKVVDYFENSDRPNHPNFSLTTIKSYNTMSAGYALQQIYGMNVVCHLPFASN